MPNNRTYNNDEDKLTAYPRYNENRVRLDDDAPISVAPSAGPIAPATLPSINEGETSESTDVAENATAPRQTYVDLYNEMVNPPLSREQEEERKRGATAVAGVKALGNVANAFSNLIFTGKGAPSQVLPKQEDPDLQTYSDRLRAQREAFANGRIRAQQMDEARENEMWMRGYRQAESQRKLQQYRENLELKKQMHKDTLDDKAAGRASSESIAEANRKSRESEGAKNRANSRGNALIRAAAAKERREEAEEKKGKGNIVKIITPVGGERTFRKKDDGETYIDDALAELKRYYPELYKNSLRRNQKTDWAGNSSPLTTEQKKAIIADVNNEAKAIIDKSQQQKQQPKSSPSTNKSTAAVQQSTQKNTTQPKQKPQAKKTSPKIDKVRKEFDVLDD